MGKYRALHLVPFTSLLSFSVPFFLSPSRRKLKISVNNDAKTLKFYMRHPWIKSLNFGEIQIVFVFVSLLIGLLTYCNLTNVGVSPVLDEVSF